MVAGSILGGNLDQFVTTMSWVVGYSIDNLDWERINTDWLDGSGGEYEFTGFHKMKFGFSVDHDKEMVRVTVDVPAELEPQVELAIAIFQNFQLRDRRRSMAKSKGPGKEAD